MAVGEAMLALGAGERPASVEQFSAAIDPQWIADALATTDTASVVARASAIHAGSIAALNAAQLAGRSPAPTASTVSPNPIAPTSCGDDHVHPIAKRIQIRSLTR